MDDMVYQYNNQNSIYVLNSSFSSYGEFGRLNLIACPQLNPIITDERSSSNCQQSQLSAMTGNSNNNNNSCSTVSRTLQHKLKTLGTLNATEGIGNPTVSSMPSPIGTCSPAAAALQKLFNCSSSVVGNNINSCNNSSHNNTSIGKIGSSSSCCGSSNNHGNIIRDCLSTTETDNSGVDAGAMLCNGNNTGSSSSNSNNSNTGVGKKKCTNVKSTLIAKKTKFWKYLEEEKWRTHDSIENLSTTNCERNRDNTFESSSAASFAFYGNSLVNNSTTTPSSAASASASSATGGPSNYNNHYASNITTQQQQQQQQRREQEQPQYKSNNWSGNHDSNNQKQLKSSSELYKEAAELLGLSCTLCDNCRCLDCQSGYFDCDDSDTYSEYSLMDEYDENTTAECLMQSDYDYDDNATTYVGTQQQQQQQLDLNIVPDCNVTTCNIEVCGIENITNVNATTAATRDTDDVAVSNDELNANSAIVNASPIHRRLSPNNMHQLPGGDSCNSYITTQPLLTATSAVEDPQNQQQQQWRQHQINELENCTSFNELSLMDVKTKNVAHQREQQQQVLTPNQHMACGAFK